MTYVGSAADQERKLQLAESAAAAAVLEGCDPAEVRRRVEVGIADALDLERRQREARAMFEAATGLPGSPAVPTPRADTPALDSWAA